ncbi:MAG: response regulator [Saprospiraceae bacterium]|nr:response regulator [Saprospiraceae bacterium]
MTRVLVVDDEEDLEILIRQKFRQQIRDKELEFYFAGNGVQALEKLHQINDIEVVLSDINMPEMDGLTLLSKMAEQFSLLKSIIVSAYGDMDNIRTAMNRGAFDFIMKPIDFEDLTLTLIKTSHHVKQLKETIKAIKENNILKMYVDESVIHFMGNQAYEETLMKSEMIHATVAFFDICEFTSVSETAPPDTVVALLNEYFDLMARSIIAHDGSIDKFMGDCVMAVFKAEGHLERAIDAALAIRDQFIKLPASSLESHFVPKISIGINLGEMVSGNIGSATIRRLDYTVIGDSVNTAQRLQSAATANQILITEEAYQQIKHLYRCHSIGYVKLKNKLKEVILYELDAKN